MNGFLLGFEMEEYSFSFYSLSFIGEMSSYIVVSKIMKLILELYWNSVISLRLDLEYRDYFSPKKLVAVSL
jgi:hypothetical protein